MRSALLTTLALLCIPFSTSWAKIPKKKKEAPSSSHIVVDHLQMDNESCRLMKSTHLAGQHRVHCQIGRQWLLQEQKAVFSLGPNAWIVSQPDLRLSSQGIQAWYVSPTEDKKAVPLTCWRNQNEWNISREGTFESLEFPEGPLKLSCRSGHLERIVSNEGLPSVAQSMDNMGSR